MLKLTDYAAVIFDLDGLILDTEHSFRCAWQTALTQMGYTVSEEFWHALSGLQYGDIANRLSTKFAAFDLEAFSNLSSSSWRKEVESNGIRVKPGLHELLSKLQDIPLPYVIATNSTRNNALECLDLAGLSGSFELLLSRDDVKNGKPEPDIYYAVAQRLNLSIKECLVLEDSYSGVLSAHRAGAKVVYVQAGVIDQRALELADSMMTDLGQLVGDMPLRSMG